ncbi:MAG: hypothetical protein AB7K09_08705 [Planctomycetota bacterium]
MIAVEPPPEPPEFDAEVRRPGQKWLKEHTTEGRPRAYWSDWKPCRTALWDGFAQRCAYLGHRIDLSGVTVDHFISVEENRGLAYEWSNYRCASFVMNSVKQSATGILDPFEVGPDWFRVLLPSCQLEVGPGCPPGLRDKAEFTIRRLGLRDGQVAVQSRFRIFQRYQSGKMTLDQLRDWAPLIAEAVERAVGSDQGM